MPKKTGKPTPATPAPSPPTPTTPTSSKEKRGGILPFVIGDVGVALGLDVVYHELKDHFGKKVGQAVSDKVFNDLRGELLADFAKMSDADSCNLWRRHEDATRELWENAFVTLLIKIPKEGEKGKENRVETLKWLNARSDKQFAQALIMLENDIIFQKLGWALKKIESLDFTEANEIILRARERMRGRRWF